MNSQVGWRDWMHRLIPDRFLEVIKKRFVSVKVNAETQTQMNQLEKQLNSMLAWLRSRKTAEGISLNQLPLILLLGARSAGKTSLLNQSEIPFVLEKKSKSQSEETRFPAWFVSTKHVWIDLPGKWFSLKKKPVSDPKAIAYDALWQQFCLQLKRKKPNEFSAVFICIPINQDSFLPASKKQMAFWRLLARRIRVIQDFFPQVIFHLVFTQSDRIPGFTSFFRELSLEESQQVYGIHLSTHLPLQDQMKAVDQLYSSLVHRIKNQMLLRLHREQDPLEKMKMLQFPASLEQLKTNVLEGLTQLIGQTTSICFGGVYWTSAHREIENNAFESISESAQLPTVTIHPEISRPYFIHHLMQGIKKSKVPIKKWATYFPSLSYAAMAGVLWMTGAMLFDVMSANGLMNQFANLNLHYQQNMRLPFDAQKNLKWDMQYSEGLKQLLTHRYSAWRYFSKQAEKTIASSQKRFIDQQILLSWQRYLGDQLLHAKPDSPEVYVQLQGYLMLAGALPKDPLILKNIFLSHHQDWKNMGVGEDYFQFCLQRLMQSGGQQLPLDAGIVAQARQLLWNRPVSELAMIVLENQSQADLSPTVSLMQSTQPLIFYTQQSTDIQSLFTVTALQKVLSEKLNQALQVAIHGNSVLGLPMSARSIDEKAELALLQQRYLKTYVSTWESALFHLRLTEPSNLQEADNMITLMISDRSPLLSLLRVVHAHTYFSPMTDMSATLQSLGGLWLGQAHSDLLLNIFSKLKSVHDYLQPILTADNPNKAAYIALAQRKPEDKPDVLTALYLVSEDCPEPLKQWLRRLANHTWRQLLASSNAYMNTAMNQNKKVEIQMNQERKIG